MADTQSIKRPIILPLLLVLIFIMLIMIFALYRIQGDQNRSNIQQSLLTYERLFNVMLDEEARLMSGQIDFIQDDPELIESYLSQDREALQAYLEPLFLDLRDTYLITHFYIHDTDRVNYLRVHNPPRYGDFIDRFTMQGAAETQTVTSGIELGRFGTFSLRTVAPWVVDDELIGYLELGMEIDHITPILTDTLSADHFFLIEKEWLNQEDWEEGLAMMNQEGDWNELTDHVIIDRPMPDIPGNLEEALETPEDEWQDFEIRISDRLYQAGRLHLDDAGDRHPGDIIVLQDITQSETSVNQLMISMIAVAGIAGGVLAVFFNYYIGGIERRLQTAQANQLTDVARREQRLLTGIMNNASAAMYVRDHDGRYMLVNKTYLKATDYNDAPETIIGKSPDDVLPESIAEQERTIIRTVLDTRTPQQHDESYQRADETRHFTTWHFPIYDENDQVYAVGSIATDITDQKRLEAEQLAVEQERQQLQQEVIEAQKQAIKELSTPIIPVTDGVIILPLVGSVDTQRSRDIMRSLLAGITQHEAQVVIIDITGVSIIDTGVAQHLNKTIRAARLKGAQTIVTGISPELAETIVDLGIDWHDVETMRDLQSGLQIAMTQRNQSVTDPSRPTNGTSE